MQHKEAAATLSGYLPYGVAGRGVDVTGLQRNNSELRHDPAHKTRPVDEGAEDRPESVVKPVPGIGIASRQIVLRGFYQETHGIAEYDRQEDRPSDRHGSGE